MDRGMRRRIGGGLFLILLGGFLLSYQLQPELFGWLRLTMGWPLIIVGSGLALFVLGLLMGAPGMAAPAVILAGIGGLLYYQNTTGDWGSWSYAWSLIPGFVGIGILLAGLLGSGTLRDSLERGGTLILISLVLFLIFGSFLGGLTRLGNYWPVLLIVIGLILLARSFFPRR